MPARTAEPTDVGAPWTPTSTSRERGCRRRRRAGAGETAPTPPPTSTPKPTDRRDGRQPRGRSVRPLRGRGRRGPAGPRGRCGSAASPAWSCAWRSTRRPTGRRRDRRPRRVGRAAAGLRRAPPEGIWDDIRVRDRRSITRQGGTAEDARGPLGTELQTRMPGRTRRPHGLLPGPVPRRRRSAVVPAGGPQRAGRDRARGRRAADRRRARHRGVVRGDGADGPARPAAAAARRARGGASPRRRPRAGGTVQHRRPDPVRAGPRDHRDPLGATGPRERSCAPQHQTTGKPGLRERLAGRFTRSEAELEADELQQDADRLGGTPIAELADRSEASVCGRCAASPCGRGSTCPPWSSSCTTGARPSTWSGSAAADRRHRAGHLPDRARPGDLQERHPDDLQPRLRDRAAPWPLTTGPAARGTRCRRGRSRRSSGPGCRRRSAGCAVRSRPALPTVAFVGVVGLATHDVTAAVAASAVVVLVLLVARLVARQTPRYVLSAVLATAVAAFFALRSGRAAGRVPAGHPRQRGWAAGALVSVLARWPVVGFVVGAGDPRMADDPLAWRRDRGPGAGLPAADDGAGRALRRCASRSCCRCTSPAR